MFNEISWMQFFQYTIITAVLYYGYILVTYFRPEIIHLFGKNKDTLFQKGKKNENTSKQEEHYELQSDPAEIEAVFSQAIELSESIKRAVEETALNEGGKEELFYLLRKKIQQYPAVAQTPFMVSLNQLILSESEKHNIQLSDLSDLNTLWNQQSS